MLKIFNDFDRRPDLLAAFDAVAACYIANTIGVTVAPLDKAEEVVGLAREQAEREQKTREWVAQGKTVDNLLAEFGRI